MANVLLGVTGSVAALRTPDLYGELCRSGHAVKVVTTRAARYFFDADALRPGPGGQVLFGDQDEWPGERYRRGDPVLHIELRRWADVFAIAPLDANTLAKLANGLCDNCLTCVWRAWDPARPTLLAPAMNTLMWEHPLTALHLRQLARLSGTQPPDDSSAEALIAWMNENCPTLRLAAPVSKVLACGDVGVGAMAAVDEIVAMVSKLAQH